MLRTKALSAIVVVSLGLGIGSTVSIANPPNRAIAESKVRQKCASDFPDNFSTQAYCVKVNLRGYAEFVASRAAANPILATSYDKCEDDFGREGSWSTAAYCAKKNTEGYIDFQRIKSAGPSALSRAYAKCEVDFGIEGSWSTAAYCAKRQRDAYNDLRN